jgi:ABC-type sugar transport system ATPase subunit
VIFGLFPSTTGKIQVHGNDIRFQSAREAIQNGIFLIPGDRRVEGLIDVQPVFFNISLAGLKRIANSLGLVRQNQEKRDTYALVEQLSLNPPDVKLKVSFLSGGNQQKVVICKGRGRTLYLPGADGRR